jgi:tRNA threonylcarbamoyladenosine biosynthesis protein TsaE
MDPLQFVARSEQDTQRLGSLLAQLLPPGTVVALCGTLGAGKTRLVQAAALASGVEPDRVVSPTFTLCHEYQGDRPVYHVDLYRIADEDELAELGLEEYFESDGVTFVEWADRFPQQLPHARLEVQIEILEISSRRFSIHGTTVDCDAIVQRLANRLKADEEGKERREKKMEIEPQSRRER